MNFIKKILGDGRRRELVFYAAAGAITTLINWGAYTLVSRASAWLLGISHEHPVLILIATIIGWAASVAFAFWANKKYVFRSPGWDKNTLRRELPGFITARLLSLGFDALFVELAVHALGMHDLLAKLISNLIVIVLNYFASKFWIFRKRGR